MRFVLALGATATAGIDGISAAGADPASMAHTPAADAELVEYGRTVWTPTVPVSPTGCPTPALVTRAIRELLDLDVTFVDAGLAAPTAAPTVSTGAEPGGDVREAEPVPDAGAIVAAARRLGRALPDDEVFVGESVPGGTTTALGILRALGEPYDVSSSLPENPLDRKHDAVAVGLDASDISQGNLAGAPTRAIRRMGDPVLAAVVGLGIGATSAGIDVTLAGGTQMVAAAALLRHAGVEAPLRIATTSFVASDASADLDAAATDLDVDVIVTDPAFDRTDHASMARYRDGEAKEGAGMGGALALADRAGVPPGDVRERIAAVYDRVVTDDGS